MIRGIGNTGNSCYMASVIQCLRRIHDLLGLDPIESREIILSGDMEDAHEFYLRLMNMYRGSSLEHELAIKFQDGTEALYLMFDQDLRYVGPRIRSMGRAVCAYIHPGSRYLSDLNNLIISDRHHLYLVGAIAFIPEAQHYYALVRDGDRFLKCDDSIVTNATDGPHNLYMLFFVYISNVSANATNTTRSIVLGDHPYQET